MRKALNSPLDGNDCNRTLKETDFCCRDTRRKQAAQKAGGVMVAMKKNIKLVFFID
ncbi:MAG: hypothetical protein QF406_03565 [Verrucomicrobiota bacterium]|nr:hypothetical protein [Verrucomicrobiota bacterium]